MLGSLLALITLGDDPLEMNVLLRNIPHPAFVGEEQRFDSALDSLPSTTGDHGGRDPSTGGLRVLPNSAIHIFLFFKVNIMFSLLIILSRWVRNGNPKTSAFSRLLRLSNQGHKPIMRLIYVLASKTDFRFHTHTFGHALCPCEFHASPSCYRCLDHCREVDMFNTHSDPEDDQVSAMESAKNKGYLEFENISTPLCEIAEADGIVAVEGSLAENLAEEELCSSALTWTLISVLMRLWA